MDAIEEIGDIISKAVSEAVKKAVTNALKEVASKQKSAKANSKPASLKLHKTAFKVKDSKYNNGSRIVIVEKGKDSIAFALNKEDWLKLREFLDSYFGIADNGNSSNGSKPKSYNGRSYSKKSYSKKSNNKPAVKVVKGYSKALDEEEAD